MILKRIRWKWKCWKCKLWCELVGILGFAAIMTTDPESTIALAAMKATYSLLIRKYGRQITLEKFIKNTKYLLGILNDVEFIAVYPSRICAWFNKC